MPGAAAGQNENDAMALSRPLLKRDVIERSPSGASLSSMAPTPTVLCRVSPKAKEKLNCILQQQATQISECGPRLCKAAEDRLYWPVSRCILRKKKRSMTQQQQQPSNPTTASVMYDWFVQRLVDDDQTLSILHHVLKQKDLDTDAKDQDAKHSSDDDVLTQLFEQTALAESLQLKLDETVFELDALRQKCRDTDAIVSDKNKLQVKLRHKDLLFQQMKDKFQERETHWNRLRNEQDKRVSELQTQVNALERRLKQEQNNIALKRKAKRKETRRGAPKTHTHDNEEDTIST